MFKLCYLYLHVFHVLILLLRDCLYFVTVSSQWSKIISSLLMCYVHRIHSLMQPCMTNICEAGMFCEHGSVVKCFTASCYPVFSSEIRTRKVCHYFGHKFHQGYWGVDRFQFKCSIVTISCFTHLAGCSLHAWNFESRHTECSAAVADVVYCTWCIRDSQFCQDRGSKEGCTIMSVGLDCDGHGWQWQKGGSLYNHVCWPGLCWTWLAVTGRRVVHVCWPGLWWAWLVEVHGLDVMQETDTAFCLPARLAQALV